jgi:peptidoglycan/xylan/chitin deacetylase (PgdA/CDA1 family)
MKTLRYWSGFMFGFCKLITLQLRKTKKEHRSSEKIICIYFHSLSTIRFIKIIRWLKNNHFRFVSENEVIDFLNEKKEIRGGIWLTFDDGWRNILELIPILERYNIPITVSLTTHAIFNKGVFWSSLYEEQNKFRVGYEFHNLPYDEKIKLILSFANIPDKKISRNTLTPEEAKIFGQHPLVSFGLHTHHHVSLLNCSDEEVEEELNLNLQAIHKIYSREVKSFAYPHGLTDRNHGKVFSKMKISIAMITGNKSITKESDPYLLPRYGYSEASLLENYCKFMDCWYKRRI